MWLPLTRPLLGTWPATQSCALTWGNQTGDPLVCRPALNPLSYIARQKCIILLFCWKPCVCFRRLIFLPVQLFCLPDSYIFVSKWTHMWTNVILTCWLHILQAGQEKKYVGNSIPLPFKVIKIFMSEVILVLIWNWVCPDFILFW